MRWVVLGAGVGVHAGHEQRHGMTTLWYVHGGQTNVLVVSAYCRAPGSETAGKRGERKRGLTGVLPW